MTDKEVMQMAIDALKHLCLHTRAISGYDGEKVQPSIEALRTALAQPEPDPVAWMYDWTTSDGEFIQDWTTSEAETLRDTEPNIISNIRPLYTAQRTWVGLTQDELNMIGDSMRTWNSHSLTDVYVAIEVKLKEKNT